ncbi:hypothetical protein [Streptomyces kasugaensis]|nr:hypothetical protein [Streptomyces kasugaensis]
MVNYAATLAVPRRLVLQLSHSLGARRRAIGIPRGSHALGCFRQARLVLR